MSSSTRLHRAIAIIPLAVLSAAWTANLAGVGVDPASADPDGSQTLPDGTVLPTAAIEAPASVGDAVTRAAALTPGTASDIPQAALSAYQRAEAVINEADKGCNLPWELVAAIGRVESDHGRFGGNVLDDRGVARPGILGIALNGKNDTQRILDTDAGQYDGDTRFDRAVGPMQFIPSTWSVVGVDGDNDGTRDPQDIDDAALATAVYLCSGEDDLSSEKGQRASVYRYNHSNAYVDLVLEIMQAYLDGDFSAVPTSTLTSGVIVPDPTASTGGNGGQGGNGGGNGSGQGSNGGKGDDGDKDDDDSSPTKDPSPTQTPTQSPTQTQGPTPTQDPTQSATQDPTTDPTKDPTEDPTVVPTVDPTTPLPTLPTTAVPTVVPTILTEAGARARCIESGISEADVIALTACIANLLNP
ncbi:MAG TPA: lytic murein transglycosylase [Nocardioides sp.]|nr:lytic murein transglycosylase [Nocardioides sp.]